MPAKSKSPFSIKLPRRVEINRKLHAIDQTLWLLATINPASLEAVSTEPMDKIRKQLVDERAALTSELGKIAREPVRPTGSRIATTRRGTGYRPREHGFLAMFQTGSCNPTEVEIVNIPPVEFGCDFFTLEGVYDYSSFQNSGFDVSTPPSGMVATVQIRDPNNDPFNSDANGVFVAPWWRYQLPERALRARYDLSISASLGIDVAGSSNHAFGTWFWGCWANGFLAFLNDDGAVPDDPTFAQQLEFQGNDIVAVGPKPIFDAVGTTPYDSGDAAMARTIEVVAGDAPPEVVLGFPLLFWVDRGAFTGTVTVNHGDAAATLRCTIEQNP